MGSHRGSCLPAARNEREGLTEMTAATTTVDNPNRKEERSIASSRLHMESYCYRL